MPIETDAQLEQAMQELQRLRAAEDGTPEARRRDELEAEIHAYTLRHGDRLRKGRPRG